MLRVDGLLLIIACLSLLRCVLLLYTVLKRDILKQTFGELLSTPHVYYAEILQKTTLLNSSHLSHTLHTPTL